MAYYRCSDVIRKIYVGIYSQHLSSVLHGCLGCSWPGIRHKTRTSCVLRRLSEEPLLKEQKCSCLLNEARTSPSSARKSFWLLKLYFISHIVCQPLLSHRLTDHHLAAIVCGRYQLITSIQWHGDTPSLLASSCCFPL